MARHSHPIGSSSPSASRRGSLTPRRSRKGFYFTLDALFGVILLLTGLLVIAKISHPPSHTAIVERYSQDIAIAFSSMHLRELYAGNNSFVVDQVQNGNITDLNATVLEQIGTFWATGRQDKASALIDSLISGAIPGRFGISVTAEGETLYARNITGSPAQEDVVSTRRMIAGIAESKPVSGSASSAYLRKILGKRTASYIYFGGFVGQGNITVFTDDVPTDFNGSRVTELTLEGDAVIPFRVFVNSAPCNYSQGPNSSSIFTQAVVGNLTPMDWNITGCAQSMGAGRNNFTISFIGNLSDSYIAGGFIRIKYQTSSLIENVTTGHLRYYFPDITGLVNLYDSVYIPGDLLSVDASIHLLSNYSSYLTIGNADFTFNVSNLTQQNIITSAEIASRLAYRGLDYTNLSRTTVPVKVGIGAVVLQSGASQTMLVTDTSGSMSGEYMDNLNDRWSGYSILLFFNRSLAANQEVNFSFNLSYPGFTYDSIGVNGTGLGGGNVDLWVDPPNVAETRAQCDENPQSCDAVDNDNDEYYYRDPPVNGSWRVRIKSSTAQMVHVDVLLSKLDPAKSADRLFSEILLNATGPTVGLVEYGNDVKSGHNLTRNLTEIQTQINSYTAGDGTCICCGINNATKELTTDGQLTFVNRGDTWKYNDSKLASDPAQWKNLSFVDTTWRSGQGSFGNGSGGYPTSPPGRQTEMKLYQGYYYFRKVFNATNVSSLVDVRLALMMDTRAEVYLNNVLIYNSSSNDYNSAVYWTDSDIFVNKSYLVNGQNIIAVRLLNANNSKNSHSDNGVGFDAQLAASRSGNAIGALKTIVVMTDGQANVECSLQNTGNAIQDAIKAACDAYTNYGIVTNTVGFGIDADQATLRSIANSTCGHGKYYNASNVTGLIDVFESLANSVIQSTGVQTLLVIGNINNTRLYGDSYLDIAYTPIVEDPQPNELSVRIQSPQLAGCNGAVDIPAGIRIANAQLTSYSGPYWTDTLYVNNVSVYNLSVYSTVFTSLGDPFIIQVPPNLLVPGQSNSLRLTIGDNPDNHTSCSYNNTLIYTALVNSSTERSSVTPYANGCNWSVQFDDGTIGNVKVPPSYTGPRNCNYTSVNISYDPNDAYDNAISALFRQLDFNQDGKILVNIGSEDLEIIVTLVGKVPYLWGPSVIAINVWR